MPTRATTASLQQGFHDERAREASARWRQLTDTYMQPGYTLAEAADARTPPRPSGRRSRRRTPQ